MLLPDDHIDLLVTAMADWELLADGRHRVTTPMLEAVGRSLRVANIESERAQQRIGRLSGRDATMLATAQPSYTWSRVPDPYEPVDILKATHAAIDACSQAPQWITSRTHQVLMALATAAAQRMPGYTSARWVWTRAESITPAIGYAGHDDQLAVAGLTWVEDETLTTLWESAVLVVLTPSALDRLDPTLPERRNVVVLTLGDPLTESQWEQIASLGDAVAVVESSVGLPWLEDTLSKLNGHADPALAS